MPKRPAGRHWHCRQSDEALEGEMRQITNKYAGECAGCGTELPTGSLVWYERRCGIRCDTCKPADTEALRAIREAGAERKAAKIEEWAAACVLVGGAP